MPTTRFRVTAAVLLALTAMPALAACSLNPVEGIVEQVTGGDVSLGGSLPEGFPSDAVPLVDGEIAFGLGVNQAEGQAWNVSIVVDGPEAYERISTQLQDAGFTAIDALGGQASGGGFSNDAYGVLVVVSDDGSGQWLANYTVTPTTVGQQ